jgi:hypothetical protein
MAVITVTRTTRSHPKGRDGMKKVTPWLITASLLAVVALPAAAQTIDGTLDAAYGPPLVVQNNETQFGDASLGQTGYCNGSELDAAYGGISGGALYLFLAGNLESNFNKLELFFDAIPGGQNKLRGDNPNVDFDGLNRMGDDGSGNGLTFDAGVDMDHWIGVTGGDAGGNYALFANYAELLTTGGGAGYYLGTTGAASNGVLTGGTNPNGIEITIDNSNTGGVAGGCGTGAGGGGVTTGIELKIPLAALGNPTDCIRVTAFINGGGHDFVSNQVLAGVGGFCNLGEPRVVNFNTPQFPFVQFFNVCTPLPTPVKSSTWGSVKTLYR